MRVRAATGVTLVALWATMGCPQLRDDDFQSGLDAGYVSGRAGTTAGDGLGGNAGRSGCPAGSGGCGDAASAGAGAAGNAGSPNRPEADAGTEAECSAEEETGPDGVCYFVGSTERDWVEARASCQARGAGWDLVTISDATQNDFVQSITSFEAWIGATDVVDEGTWSWTGAAAPFFEVGAATNAEFANWNAGEPNDFDGSDCLRMLTTGLWADWPCANLLGYVCSRAP